MLIEEALGKLIEDSPGVSSIIGVAEEANLYCPLAPQDVQYPNVVFRMVPPTLREPLMTPSGFTEGLVRTRSRVRVFSSMKTRAGYAVAKRLNQAVRKALNGFQGIVINDTVSPIESVEIQGIFPHTTQDIDEFDEKTEVMSIISDFDVWHVEEL
jgi:hypothetical protein